MILAQRPITRVWLVAGVRVAILATLIWCAPTTDRVTRHLFDTRGERAELAQNIERQQRASDELVVLPSGETRHAVVRSSLLAVSAQTHRGRGLRYWFGFFIGLVIMKAVQDSLLVGDADESEASTTSHAR